MSEQPTGDVLGDFFERGAADRTAAESEVRAALELMPQLVWTTTPDGYHDYYNQRWYDFTGMPRPGDPDADAEGWNWNTYLHPDDYERTVAVWSNCLATGSPYEIEYRFREKKTGEFRWFLARALPLRDDGGRIIRWFGTCTDIHDDKVLRERLIESEERFRNSMHYSAIGHALVGRDGRFIQVNPALARIVGRTADELAAMRFQDITHPDDLDLDLEHLRKLSEGAVKSYEMDKRYIHRDGHAVWVQLTVSAVRSGADEPLYFVAQMQDLTTRRALEQQLRESQKLEAVGRLAGGVAHDFNNLLGAILGFTELLLADAPAGSETRADLEGIRTAAERGARLTTQLLTFGRRHLRRPAHVDLGATVMEAEGLIRQFAGAHVQVVVEAERDTFVRADPGEVDQILINLVVNARDAMRSGGALHVRVASVDSPGGAAPSTPTPGPYVLLSVADTGDGIAADVLPRIFEPFFSTKAESGAGLGLATVHGIVSEVGGTISVDTAPGAGTRMTVLLPRDTSAVAEPQQTTTRPPATAQRRTVLLVEDEAALRNVCTRVLSRAGYTVIAARHGRDALDLWAEHGERIDVLVTDLMMPELGGRELAAELHRLRPALPVVFMSGYTDDELMRRALHEPTVTLLAKPFSPAALTAAVEETLAGAASREVVTA